MKFSDLIDVKIATRVFALITTLSLVLGFLTPIGFWIWLAIFIFSIAVNGLISAIESTEDTPFFSIRLPFVIAFLISIALALLFIL